MERKEINASHGQKTFMQKLGSAFIPEDVSNVGEYLLTQWVLPGVWDFIQTGVNSVMPKTGGGSRPVNVAGSITKPKVANIANNVTAYNKVYDRVNGGYQQPTLGDYTNIMIPDVADANMVLMEMREMCDDEETGTGQVPVGWFLDRCGEKNIPPQAWDWGWRDLKYARVERFDRGWRIVFPRTVSLKP
ncbi:MAG: hypothetical protein J6Y02_01135 [Pseudobutyrivibrio sp.]|nr:hypothetical protein [Pseudobutyrivibrio sp.]